MGSDKTYGVWKATPTSYTGQTLEQDKSPHIYLKFDDGSGGKEKEAAINVASTDTDKRLVYWLNRTWNHPITKGLTPLEEGFHEVTATSGKGTDLSLDFIRTTPALVDFADGTILQDEEPGSSNILGDLEPILKDAIAAKATVYIFGTSYGTGIDDVHMNQGNDPKYTNSVGQDGAIIFHYAGSDAHFEAVFLAFASQEIPTNDETGDPTSDAKELATIVQNSSAGTATSSS